MENVSLLFLRSGNKVSIDLERRITYLTGLSGEGKTTFSSLLMLENDARVERHSTLPIVPVVYGALDIIKSAENSVLLVDDLGSLQSTDFLKLVNGFLVKNNSWLLVIGREHFTERAYLPYVAFSSVYVIHSVGDEFRAEKLAIQNRCTVGSVQYDKIYVEDSGSGFDFVKAINRTNAVVESLNGATNLLRRIKELRRSGITNINIFAFVDMASFGCDALQLMGLLSLDEYSGFNVCVMSDYECFEELLLRTNMFIGTDTGVDDADAANKYLSWEKFYEQLIDSLTKHKMYRAYHGHMVECYTKNCCHLNSFHEKKCEFHDILNCNKFYFLLLGTKYERLLELYKK